jgi:SAM-dependent methyltransferase
MKNCAHDIPASEIRDDFDRIAPLARENWSHSSHHYPFLLRHVPERCVEAIDIGCGTGSFSRLLAAHAERVIGLDLSPQMIRVAVERSRDFDNITYVVADATEWSFPAGTVDCIATIATMHHLPFDDMVGKFKAALRPGGVVLILDLYESSGFEDRVVDGINVPANVAVKLAKTRRLREPKVVRDAWAAHGRHDFYLTLSLLRGNCKRHLPGAAVRRHMFWRYSIIWKKPQDWANTDGVL